MAQRDPLVEYQREGGDMFHLMMEAFMEEVVGFVFHLGVEVREAPMVGVVTDSDGQAVQIGSDRTENAEPKRSRPLSSGRNLDPTLMARAYGCIPSRTSEFEPAEAVEATEPRAGRRVRVSRAWPVRANLARRLGLLSALAEDGAYVLPLGKTASTGRRPVHAGVGRNAPCPCGSSKKFKMPRPAGASPSNAAPAVRFTTLPLVVEVICQCPSAR